MSTPSLKPVDVEKVVVMSDLHLGEEECILNPYKGPDGKPVPERDKNISRLIGMIKKEREIDELILLGDFLDLSLVSLEEAYSNAREFFSKFGNFGSIKRITYVPGNHDHHVWVQLIEQREVIEKLKQGHNPTKKEDLTKFSVRSAVGETFLENLLPKKHPPLIVEYPDIMRKIKDTEKYYYFTHGHYLEDIFTPVTKLLGLRKKVSLVNLEAFNCAWLEA